MAEFKGIISKANGFYEKDKFVNSLKSLNHSSEFWFALSLIFPLYFGLVSLHYALSQNYIVQDDARQHIIWLQRFIDPQLFQNDLIADYFQAVAPAGYKFFYWSMAKIGIEPVILAKILPIILGLITTVYLFKLSLQILPIPASAFLITLIFNQHLWLKDDLISATPRAFLYPIFAAFLYYLSKRSLFPCLATLALQGIFYPPLLLLEVAILTVRLFRWQGCFPRLSSKKENYIVWLSGLAVALIVLLPFALKSSAFGPVVTAAQMKAMPEYGMYGRCEYFETNWLKYILTSPSGLGIPLFPSVILFSLGFPFLVRSQLPLVKLITREVNLLWQIILASLGMFFLSHLFLMKLHFPSRYTYHSLRFVMSIAAEIVLLILFDTGRRWLQKKRQNYTRFKRRELLLIGLTGLATAIFIIVPAIPSIFLVYFQNWIVGDTPQVYQFLANQPQDTLVASLAKEADNLPAFSFRSILVSEEFAFPHHSGYYKQIKQRIIDTIIAQYSSDLLETKRIIKKYGIDYFMIEPTSFDPDYLLMKNWLIHSSFRSVVFEAIAQLNRGETPALAKMVDRCSVLSTSNLILLEANCINKI